MKNLVKILIATCFFFALEGCSKEELPVNIVSLTIGDTYPMQCVQFVNDSVGYMGGGTRFTHTELLKTTDGGTSWNRLNIQTEKTIYAFDFLSADNGFAADFNGMVIKTADGGNSFATNTTFSWNPIRSIQMLDSMTVFAAGGVGWDNGYIHRSLDGGLSWTYQYIEKELRDIHFTSATEGFVCGYGILSSTKDGGNSWAIDPTVQGDFFTAMDFPSSSVGYLAGYNGTIHKTTNGGDTWEKLLKGNHPFERQSHFNDIHFYGELNGLIVGNNGLAFYTNDGGLNWQRLADFTDEDLFGIWLNSATSGFVVGDNGAAFKFDL